jgi:thymidine kinase
MRGNLETIVGAMFAGKTSELLKRILWAKHQNKKNYSNKTKFR